MTSEQQRLLLLICSLGCMLCGSVGCKEANQATSATVKPPVLAIQPPSQPLGLVSGSGLLGSADFGELRSSTYRVRNNSSQSITLKVIDKSCSCAGVQLPETTVAPGKEAEIILHWLPKADVLESTTVRIWADIGDSANNMKIRLEATGTIEPKIQVSFPRGSLDFGKLTLVELEQSRRVVEVYSQQSAFPSPECQCNLTGLEILQVETLPSDRLTNLQAKAGYRIVLRPTKMLPHGEFHAQLSVLTSLKKQPIMLDITGHLLTSVVSLNQEKIQLPPRLSLQTGYRVPSLTVNVRYGLCKNIVVESVTPDLFDTRVQKINESTWRIELSLCRDAGKLQSRFPPDQWQHLLRFGFDQGLITLKLDHPDLRIVTIPFNGSELIVE